MLKILIVSFLYFSTHAMANIPLVIGEQIQLYSKVLNESRRIDIYLPRTYQVNSNKKYDVLYVLDGNAHLLHAAGSQLVLAGYQQMPELLIVGIHNTNRNRDLTPSVVSSVANSGGASHFRRFIAEELIPHVAQTYRTNDKRYLSGHSYGGLFAIDTLVEQPDLFDAYFTFSPSLRWDNDLVLNKLLVQIQKTQLTKFLYVNIGDEGFKLKRPILQLHESFKASTLDEKLWHFDWLAQESHVTTPVIGQFLAFRAYFSTNLMNNNAR